ncbi:hypothetical protein BC629DRAFT_913099 [Irpex lacteus]|nr:hypothetical protein BC629DRAFT_913099 [Irpex lacteus]
MLVRFVSLLSSLRRRYCLVVVGKSKARREKVRKACNHGMARVSFFIIGRISSNDEHDARCLSSCESGSRRHTALRTALPSDYPRRVIFRVSMLLLYFSSSALLQYSTFVAYVDHQSPAQYKTASSSSSLTFVIRENPDKAFRAATPSLA